MIYQEKNLLDLRANLLKSLVPLGNSGLVKGYNKPNSLLRILIKYVDDKVNQEIDDSRMLMTDP